VAAIGLNINRLVEVAAPSTLLRVLSEFHQRLRISTAFGDMNAAGALFLLMLPSLLLASATAITGGSAR
jgi:hypothetical protein